MNIMTKGERRFVIAEITQRTPYLVALVHFLDEPVGDGVEELMRQLDEEYRALVQGLTALAGGYASQVEMPEDPVELSYAIARQPQPTGIGAAIVAGGADGGRPGWPTWCHC